MINYIPEAYYEKNITFNQAYFYSNYGAVFNNFSYFQENYTPSSDDYFIKESSNYIYNPIDFVAYKKEQRYYQYHIIEKEYRKKYYVEVEKEKEITKEEYNILLSSKN